MTFALFLLLAAAGFDELFRDGLLALRRNDLKTAETNLTAAAKLAPSNGRVWIALAQTYRKLTEPAKSEQAAAKAAQLSPNDALVQKSLAIFYTESGQGLKAAEAQTKYSILTPQDAPIREKAESLYFEAVQPLLQQQKFAEAITILSKAREQLKDSAQLELALGVALYGVRRFDDAATAFLHTITIAPEIDQPYVFLGKFLDQIPGRLADVTKQFVKYQNAHAERPTGYLLHAKALIAQSIEMQAAEELLKKAIAIDGGDPSAHFELGVIYFSTRRYEDSAKEFERSAELDPANPATHYRLSNVYSRLGKHDAARVERELHAKLAKAQDTENSSVKSKNGPP